MPNQWINITQNQQNRSHLKQTINIIVLDIEKMCFEKIMKILKMTYDDTCNNEAFNICKKAIKK